MSKVRLMAVGDAGGNTGFERVMRGVLTHLHDTGKYDITVRGIGYYPDRAVRTYPWTVKSWGGEPGDDLGVSQVPTWLDEDKPDALFVLQDPWNITAYMAQKPPELPTVAYFPVDCPNVKWLYAMGFGAVSEPVSYTHFGAREAAAGVRHATDLFADRFIKEASLDQPFSWLQLPQQDELVLHGRMDRYLRLQNPSNWNVIPHGLERGVFEPRDKAKARAHWGLPQDAFIVLNVNTNQFRKNFDRTVRAFKVLLDQRPDALLVVHCAGGDHDGVDLLQLTQYYGIEHRTAFIHHKVTRLTDDQLCWLYNTADVQINTGGGEGWGLPAFEGAACGVPQALPDWSATRELWEGYGILFEVRDWYHPKYINTAHALIDVVDAGNALASLADSPSSQERLREKSLEQAARQLTWDEVGAGFDTLIERALREPEPRAVSFEEIRNARTEAATSELAELPAY